MSRLRTCPSCGTVLMLACKRGHRHASVADAYDCDLEHEMRAVLRAIAEGRLPMRRAYVLRKYELAVKGGDVRQRIGLERMEAERDELRAAGPPVGDVAFLPWLVEMPAPCGERPA